MTLEGFTAPVTQSVYYRPDGHPRPTVGLLMAAQMFGLDMPDAPEAVKRDFGTDLLRDPSQDSWLRERAARCAGVWSRDEAADLLRARSTRSADAATTAPEPR